MDKTHFLKPNKEYLGDSVYVKTDGCGIELTTENGYPDDPSNRIYLEIDIIISLIKYVRKHFNISNRE